MADRPRNDGSGEDGPEFGWLYGKKQPAPPPSETPDATRAVPLQQRDARPDETRVMPVQRRDPGAGATTPPPPARPVPTPAPAPAPSGGGRGFRLRRPRFRLRYIPLLILLWIVYLIAVPIYSWTSVDKIDWEPDYNGRPDDQPGTTYLLVGSDSRGDLSKEERQELGTGGASGQRTDTIMLLHTGAGPNLLMSIPRDSLVDIPGHGTTKINAAYAFDGPQLLTRTIEQSTGIRVDQYVEIGMGGLASVVDAVGGIEICPTQRMKDKLANLNVEKGCQDVNGVTALGYARSRHTSNIGDIDRVKHQREVVSAVGKKVLSPWTFVNPVRYWRLNRAIPGFFGFGEGMGPTRAGMWALAMTRVNGENGMTCTVPIADLAVHWDEERSQQMFDAIAEDKVDEMDEKLCTPTGLPKSVTG